MVNHSDVDALLDQWEEHWEQGHELSAEELAKGRPELLPQVEHGIRALKATDWMLDSDSDDDDDGDFLSLPTVSGKDDETKQRSSRPLPEFIEAVEQSGRYIAFGKVGQHGDDGFARHLIARGDAHGAGKRRTR